MPSKRIGLTEAEISERLANELCAPGDPNPPNFSELLPDPPRPAAVLIPLLRNNCAWQVLLTRRNSNLQEHGGQVAFPGGRVEPTDANPETTALREAHEEIGLKPQDVRILGRLKQMRTITNYNITPIIGVIPWPYQFQLEALEVSRVFTIPLDWLANKNNRESTKRSLPPP